MINELSIRRKKMCEQMQKQNIDSALISSKINLYYLTGVIFDGYCYLTQHGQVVIFAKKNNNFFDKNIINIRKPEQIPQLLKDINIALPEKLMLEDDYLTAAELVRLQNVFNNVEIVSSIVRKVRTTKTEYEINLLKESAKLHTKLYEKIKLLYKEGMTDVQLSYAIEFEARKLGHLGIFRVFGSSMEIFMGSVVAGDNATNTSPYDFAIGGQGLHPSIPVGANGTILSKGETIAVDMSGNYYGYMLDMTRIFAISNIPQKAYDLHNISIEVQNELSVLGKSGAMCGELYEKALSIINNHDAYEYYMENTNNTRFVGHGIGLEINEMPVITKNNKTILENGMTLALEPKFILKGIGAVGTENTFVVRDDKLEKITETNEEIILL